MKTRSNAILKHAMLLGILLTGTLTGQSPSATSDPDLREHEERLYKELETTAQREPKAVADRFLNRLSGTPVSKIQAIRLSYDVHMEFPFNVKTRMNATLAMERKGDLYESSFRLQEPVGETVWSRFALFVYGRHTTEYKEMVKTIETTFIEVFRGGSGEFLTHELRELPSETKGAHAGGGIRVLFDYRRRLILFWEDQARKRFSRSLALMRQVGPMTGFFGYILFHPPETELHIINALREHGAPLQEEDRGTEEKRFSYLFDTQRVKLRSNGTGTHPEYERAIYFEKGNYLDIIHGKVVFFKLARGGLNGEKVPYSVLLEGIISKLKKRQKEEKLRRLQAMNLDTEAHQAELEKIEAIDALAAKNVEIHLREATLESREG